MSLNPGPPVLSTAPPPCPTFAQLVGTPTLLVARLLSLLPRNLSNLSAGPLDFMVSGWLGSWLRGLNNAGAWPGASWKQPGRGSRFPWVEGRLSGWCVEKPGPGSGGKCRREGGRSILQEVGWGRMWGRPGDQIPRIYPAGSVSLRSLALPISGAASHPVGHHVQGSAVLRSKPWNQPVAQGGNSGLRAGLKGQWRTLCPQPVSCLNSYAPLGLPVGRECCWEPVPLTVQHSKSSE